MSIFSRPDPRTATRLAFAVAGFVTACWAPLIPFAKARLGINNAELGVLLLTFGVGSIVGVSLAGVLAARVGARPLVIAGALGLCLVLPALAVAATPWTLGAALALFGASLGALDVAMNAHGVEVEVLAAKPLMSGFHALYSLGGFAGSGWMTLCLALHLTPLASSLAAAGVALILVAACALGLLNTRPAGHGPLFVAPSGLVVVIAALAAVMFLAEGAVFDWSALLLVERRLAAPAGAGLGFIVFSVAMTAGRLGGDAVVARLGARRVLRWGGALALAGFLLVVAAPFAPLAIGGFLLVGFGAANVVPVLFSAAGRQTSMPAGLAVAAVTSTAYIGVLAGPPALGLIAHAAGLAGAFWIVIALVMSVPVLAGIVTRPQPNP